MQVEVIVQRVLLKKIKYIGGIIGEMKDLWNNFLKLAYAGNLVTFLSLSLSLTDTHKHTHILLSEMQKNPITKFAYKLFFVLCVSILFCAQRFVLYVNKIHIIVVIIYISDHTKLITISYVKCHILIINQNRFIYY